MSIGEQYIIKGIDPLYYKKAINTFHTEFSILSTLDFTGCIGNHSFCGIVCPMETDAWMNM